MNDLLYHALQYAEAGLAVLPLIPGKKTPLTEHGLKDATTNTELIEYWWNKNPSANIGIATGMASGGISVIDLDEKGGKHGIEVFEKWASDNGLSIDPTWISRTASGGKHYFFQYSEPVKTRTDWLPGVDIRADGGYAVVPPSTLANGTSYEWIVSPFDIEKPASGTEVQIIVSEINKENETGYKEAFRAPEAISKGSRNDTLYRLACSLQAKGLIDKAIYSAVWEENIAKCIPPLPGDEVNRIVKSALTKEKGTTSTGDLDLYRFHVLRDGKPTGVFDYEVHRYLKETENIFVLGGTPYIYEHGVYRPDDSGARLKTMIRKLILPAFVRSTTIKRIYDLFTSDAELQATSEDLNQCPVEWINFQNGFYDPINKKMVDHDPKYHCTNQIPHVFDPDGQLNGTIIQEWLSQICSDDTAAEMLLQYAGLCMNRDTRQQKFLILNGSGGTGKSTLIKLIDQMVGRENVSNVSLGQLTQRFSAFGLLGKLVNSCADLEITALEDVSTLKKILGEDLIAAEAKGKDAVSFQSYARLIFSTNEIPVVKSERSNGFYRRLLILTMDRIPEKRDPDFYNKLSANIDDFIRLCVWALEGLYKQGTITESAQSIEAVNRLRQDSDVVEAFLAEMVEQVPSMFMKKVDCFRAFEKFCQDSGRTALLKSNFYKAMKTKAYIEVKHNGFDSYKGIVLREDPSNPTGKPTGVWIDPGDEPLPFKGQGN